MNLLKRNILVVPAFLAKGTQGDRGIPMVDINGNVNVELLISSQK